MSGDWMISNYVYRRSKRLEVTVIYVSNLIFFWRFSFSLHVGLGLLWPLNSWALRERMAHLCPYQTLFQAPLVAQAVSSLLLHVLFCVFCTSLYQLLKNNISLYSCQIIHPLCSRYTFFYNPELCCCWWPEVGKINPFLPLLQRSEPRRQTGFSWIFHEEEHL